jgi:hypothetical protein
MQTIIIDGIEYVPKEYKIDREPTILKKTLHFEVYCEDLEPSNWNDAIELCSKLGDGWRLPTILELQLMYENRKLIDNLKNTAYWSSTEYNAATAWNFTFNFGSTNKGATHSVRAVRSITI